MSYLNRDVVLHQLPANYQLTDMNNYCILLLVSYIFMMPALNLKIIMITDSTGML